MATKKQQPKKTAGERGSSSRTRRPRKDAVVVASCAAQEESVAEPGRSSVTDSSQIPVHVAEVAEELKYRRSARKSLVEFCKFTHPRYQDNWHHRLAASYIEQFLWGKFDGIHGLMIVEPPRHGKSEQVAIRMPAFDFLEHPDEHYIGVAYGDELATTFSRGCRNIIETPQYQRLRKHCLKSRGDTKWELVRKNDDQRASFISSGIMSSITGEGATRLVVDDPVKNRQDAYSQIIRDKTWDQYLTAATTRMAPKGKKFIIMTRWHEDDLAGRLIKKAIEDKKADQWLVIVLAATNDAGENSYIWNTKTGEKKFLPPYEALWPEAYPRTELDRFRANLGPVFWGALYMGNPTPPEGSIFKRANWMFFDDRPKVDLLIQVYDTAQEEGQENDYSASITMGSDGIKFPIFDAWRDKVGFPFLVAKVYERWFAAARTHGRYPDRVVIEKKSSGHGLIQQIKANNLAGMWVFPEGCVLPDGKIAEKATPLRIPVIPVTESPATLSKIIRAHSVSGYHESQCISLPRGQDKEWTRDFIDEHAIFGYGEALHDDWVDCTVHGLSFFTRPMEDHEEIVTHHEAIVITPGLDEFEADQLMMGRMDW